MYPGWYSRCIPGCIPGGVHREASIPPVYIGRLVYHWVYKGVYHRVYKGVYPRVYHGGIPPRVYHGGIPPRVYLRVYYAHGVPLRVYYAHGVPQGVYPLRRVGLSPPVLEP